jgi:cytoskeletal protein RodZ
VFEIGSTLRQARERRRLGLDQAEAETKIRARYLRALEDEHFDLLPGPAYVKGFLRTYAEYLELDGTLFVDEYNSRFSDPLRDEELIFPRRRSMPPRERRGRRESNVVLIALAGIVAVAVLVAVAFMYPTQHTPRAPEASVPVESSAPESTTATTDDGIQPPVNLQASEAIESDKAKTAAASSPTAEKPTKPVRLVLRATGGACWVTLFTGTDDEGEPVFVDTLDPADPNGGTSQVFKSKTGYLLEVGRPDNLELVVNGKVQSVGTADRVVIDPSGKVQALPS